MNRKKIRRNIEKSERSNDDCDRWSFAYGNQKEKEMENLIDTSSSNVKAIEWSATFQRCAIRTKTEKKNMYLRQEIGHFYRKFIVFARDIECRGIAWVPRVRHWVNERKQYVWFLVSVARLKSWMNLQNERKTKKWKRRFYENIFLLNVH